MTENKLSIIKDAFLEIEMMELKNLEALSATTFTISESCHKKIKQIITNRQSAQHSSMLKRKIITAAISALIIISISLMSISATRDPIIKFFREITESFTRIFTSGNKYPEVIEECYNINWLPEGYIETNRYEIDSSVDIYYSNGEHTLIYTQSAISNVSFVLNTENSTITEAFFGNTKVEYIHSFDEYLIIWRNNYTIFTLSCHDSIPWEEVEKIVLNIIP